MADSFLDRALIALGDRWSLQIVEALLPGAMRYNDLSHALGGIAPNVLASRLRHLEQAQLVEARPYQERPRRLEYSLTTEGRSLSDVLGALRAWAARADGHAEGGRDQQSVHQRCGTPLVVRLWCPTCEEPVSTGVDDDPVWI